MKKIIFFFFLFMYTSGSASFAGTKGEVTLCAEPDFPPFMWFVRNSQGYKTAELDGYTIDVMTLAFNRIGLTAKFDGSMPWVRCMNEVNKSRIDFGMDAYYDQARAERFKFSEPYMELTPQVYWLSGGNHKPAGKEDLKKLRGCGLHGSSYEHYGIKDNDLDLGAKDYRGLIDKLKYGRCDYFLEELEIISGFKILGTDYLADKSIAHHKVSGGTAPKLHLITGKQNGRTIKIMEKFNQQILAMKKSGELDKLYKNQYSKSVVLK